jgi:glucose-6-phosphate isomerase
MKPLIQFDHTHLIHKFSETQLHSLIKKKEAVRRDLKHKKEMGEIGFVDLPFQNKHNELPLILNLAKQIQRSKEIDTLLIIGIGGSVLGAKAAISALAKNKRPKIVVVENPNPDSLNRLFQELDLKKTTVNVISKSGST